VRTGYGTLAGPLIFLPNQEKHSELKPQQEVEFFDSFASAHGEYDVLGEKAYQKLLRLFHQHVPTQAGERVADLGCGSGAFTRRLAGTVPAAVLGMDLSPGLIAAAQKKSPRERYLVGDIQATGLPGETFSAVVYSGVLHHFPSQENRIRVLTEGHRLLRSGGRVFAFDPSAHSPSMWLYRDPASPFCSCKGKTENEVLLRRAQLLVEAKKAGFEQVEVFGVCGVTFRYVESSLARVLLPFYNLYELLMAVTPWQKNLGTFLITVGVKEGG